MTDFVYNADYSKVLLPESIQIAKTAILLQNEMDALVDWCAKCTKSTSKQKIELTRAIKEHASNARGFVESTGSRYYSVEPQIKKLLKYVDLPTSKTKDGVTILRSMLGSYGRSYYDNKKEMYVNMEKITYFGFSNGGSLKIFKHASSKQVNDNTRTVQDVLSGAKKQKNFIASAEKLESLLESFVSANKEDLAQASIKYEVMTQGRSQGNRDKQVFEILVNVKEIISSLKTFNKSIGGIISARLKEILDVDLESYKTKAWSGSFDDADNFKAKDAFYLLATSGKNEGFVGMKETNHSGGGLFRPCIVKDINNAYIFHTMPQSLGYEFENVHKINVGVDFSNVLKVGKSKDFDLALKVQAFIEKNKLEGQLASLPINQNSTGSNAEPKRAKTNKI